MEKIFKPLYKSETHELAQLHMSQTALVAKFIYPSLNTLAMDSVNSG